MRYLILFLRSALFNLLFYANLIAWMIVILPTLALPRRFLRDAAAAWARSSLWLLRVVAGTGVEFRGLENLPQGGLIVASKHQSMWETFALYPLFADGAFILKRELMWIPLFGWYLWKSELVPVNRGARSQALTDMNRRAREKLAEGRQLIIFPEGTRRPVGAQPRYKWGAVQIYADGAFPMVPVALNAGLFWPRRQFLRKPGTIIVEFLEPIPPGLPRDEVFVRLQEAIETATDRIVAEGRAELARRGLA